ncbi:sugar ABC transporter ATP-binding protein [Microbacterium sp. A1-JK]|uniref:sugar ABC transporter ATP-binding protein n=1 Tax=Microbacterium sp. A1-JK TaxID=3177516 RepID=UPI0038895A24
MSQPALTCQHVSKSFGATRAVVDVDVTLNRGEILALVGENGAGKSTLMNMLSGLLSPDTGSITIADPPEGGRAVSMVHQELSLFANLTVAENLSLGDGDTTHRSERAKRDFARSTLAGLGVDIDVDATVGDLTVGQRQLLEVAKAIAVTPTLLILDEPTSSLENPQVELLFAAVRRLSAAGSAVVFVSHRMDELFELCDRVLVMRDGRQVDEGPLAERTRDQLVASMVGREASDLYPPRDARGDEKDAAGPAAVELVDVSLDGSLSSVDLRVTAGSITAIAGLEGHGQSEVAEVVAGVRTPTSGTLRRAGRPVRLRSPRQAVRSGIGYVAPDRRLDGLLLDQSISANALLAAMPRLFPSGIVSPRRARQVVQRVVSHLAVKHAALTQPIVELSGGNQQKVLIGRWLVDDGLEVLVLNDPTRGVDVGSRAQIYQSIRELTERGVAVLLVSTDLQEILGLSDEVYVMYSGRITGRLDSRTATETAVMHLATGGTAVV